MPGPGLRVESGASFRDRPVSSSSATPLPVLRMEGYSCVARYQFVARFSSVNFVEGSLIVMPE